MDTYDHHLKNLYNLNLEDYVEMFNNSYDHQVFPILYNLIH